MEPVELILNKLCSQGIYDHVDGGISRYTTDENWLIPHFEKMLYDNAQFVSILSKFSKINNKKYYKDKIIQTVSCFNQNFINPNDGLLGSAFDADSDGVEGKFHTFKYEEINHIKDMLNIEIHVHLPLLIIELMLYVDHIIHYLKILLQLVQLFFV